MPDRHDSEPVWGPARTYRARPGRRQADGRARGIPVEEIREEDLLDADGRSLSAAAQRVSDQGSFASAGRGTGAGRYDDDSGYDDSRYDNSGYDGSGHDDSGYDSSRYDDSGYADGTDEHEGTAREYGSPRRRRGSSAAHPRARRRRRPALVLVALLLLALVAYPAALALTVTTSLHRVDALSGASDTPGRTYLLVGSDSRSGTDLEAVDGTRTDTIVMLHVPANGPAVMLSIPRDSDVKIPGHGKNKINAAYAIGGPSLLVETVEQATGVHVDGYVETGFAGFGDIVNALGGITICPRTALKDKLSGLDVQPGCQPADGTTALAYARMRHGDPLGDLGRVQRQREVISQIAGKASSPATVINPFTAFPLARAGGRALTVDKQMGLTDLAHFGLGMKQVAGGGGISLTVPISNPGKMTGHGEVVVWDEDAAQTVFDALKDDSTEAIRPIAEAQAPAAAAAAGGN